MRFVISTLAVSAATLVATPVAWAQHADEVFAERTAALALDERCELFGRGQRAALHAARLQARGALLRSGVEPGRLNEFETMVRDDTAAQDCDATETREMQAAVADAYEAYLRIPSMHFPGDVYAWDANRTTYASEADWVMQQDTGELMAGLTAIDGQIRFTIATQMAGRFSGVVLVVRDPEQEPDLYDPTLGGIFQPPEEAPWARWTPPDRARRLIWASERVRGEPIEALTGDAQAHVFRFPDSAAHALTALDPRESVRIDYLDLEGKPVLSSYFEVGDFGAALAFLQAMFNTNSDS